MRIAITTQNFRTVTGHAGRARRFLIYEVDPQTQVREVMRLDLPSDQTIRASEATAPHPLDGTSVLITASCGEGFMTKLASRGIRVVLTREVDPEIAIHAYLAGHLKTPRNPVRKACHDALVPGARP